jgi:hypothetical protein
MSLPEDSDLKLIDAKNEDDSGISLELDDGGISFDADESGITLEIEDSGISLEADDSGINLEALDSGALLGDDSGISLDVDDDSGLTLDAADSGIALFDDESGISLDADMGSTQPMSAVPGAAADLASTGAGTMELDIPDDTNDSEFELAGLDDDDDDFGTDTSVLMFDDDTGADEFSVEAQPAMGGGDDLAVEDYGTDDAFEDDLGDEEFDDDFEDDEMDDVWDAEDDADDDGFEAGESKVGGFAVPAGAAAGAGWAMQDAPWGGMWTAFVSIGALLSVASAYVGIELVKHMWMLNQPGQPASGLLGILGGMFGS